MRVTPEQQREIDELRQASMPTRRAVAPGLEEILYQALPVLDHGFVRVIDYMGDDAAVVQAARVSFGRGTRRVREDAALIGYLMRRHHSTPFEMCELKLHVKLPIFVARQWIRHRTANVNEMSARYSVLDNEFYLPPAERVAAQSKERRQGSGSALPEEAAARVLNLLREDTRRAYAHYEEMLEEPIELARELARMNLTLNVYTQWYWKIDLRNLLRFLALRAEEHAQAEIRAYADVLLDAVRRWVPAVWAAFERYRLGGAALSKPALHAVRRMLRGEVVAREDSGLSPGEWHELRAALGLED